MFTRSPVSSLNLSGQRETSGAEDAAKLRLRETARPTAERDRAGRVVSLVAVIVTLSIVDLVLTLDQMMSVGMFESNPLARQIAGLERPVIALTAFKVASVLPAACVLLSWRHRRSMEAAAWFVLFVLGYVVLQWNGYCAAMAEIGPCLPPEMVDRATWVRIASSN